MTFRLLFSIVSGYGTILKRHISISTQSHKPNPLFPKAIVKKRRLYFAWLAPKRHVYKLKHVFFLTTLFLKIRNKWRVKYSPVLYKTLTYLAHSKTAVLECASPLRGLFKTRKLKSPPMINPFRTCYQNAKVLHRGILPFILSFLKKNWLWHTVASTNWRILQKSVAWKMIL